MAKKGVTGMLACVFMSLGLALGCVDPEEGGGGSVSGTSLYVFDASEGAQSRILVYSDVAALFDDTTIQPSRRMSGTIINSVRDLAWGGMCFDANGNRLYLISETGNFVRIERARLQNGELTNPLDIVSFRLGTSDDRLPSGKFGQAFIDPRGSTLYVTEANATDTRIWVVSNPASYTSNSNVGKIYIDDDKGGTGVAATNDGAVYAYFDDGGNTAISGITYAGPRLRKGTSSGFQRDGSMIIGRANDNRTGLAKYGCLAVDNSGNVYMARHLADAAMGSGNAILRFTAGQFSPGLNQEPGGALADNITNLRIISHAVTKDWLVGGLSDGDYGRNTVLMWRSPSESSPAYKNFIVDPYVSIRGLALDGRN